MTRAEMIRFLNGKNIFASKKDSTARLHRKMARFEQDQELDRVDRLTRKMSRRIRRAVNKGVSLSRWMVEVLGADNFDEAVFERAKKVAHGN